VGPEILSEKAWEAKMNYFEKALFGVVGALALAATPAAAASYKVLYNFDSAENDISNGLSPIGDLVVDLSGNLYGTTPQGGPSGIDDGVVFELSPPSKGTTTWSYNVIYDFGVTQQVAVPAGGVLLDPSFSTSGSIYGTGVVDGVFRLDNCPGACALTLLHNFQPFHCNAENAGVDGCSPYDGPVFGLGGLLYGTTIAGGRPNSGQGDVGTVFAVSPTTPNNSPISIYTFSGTPDGAQPYLGRLAVDAKGNMYGMTGGGGANGAGAVFEMTFKNNAWSESIIYSFGAFDADLLSPTNGVVLGKGGVLYGCANGGANHVGGVFMLTPPKKGTKAWSETILYNFGDQQNDPSVGESQAAHPACAVALDPKGQLFGTSGSGGMYQTGTSAGGTFFQLTPPAPGQSNWTESVLHSFGKLVRGSYVDGENPQTIPVKFGNSYFGETEYGGSNNTGTIYKITP
jgi:uncharacterized repeat protein (TIGR03803 family)